MSVCEASTSKMVGDIIRALGYRSSLICMGGRIMFAGSFAAFFARSNVFWFCIVPSVPIPILGFSTRAATSFLSTSTTVWYGMVSLSVVLMPSCGMKKFCGAVHICPEYSDMEKARFLITSRRSRTESMITELTPAFSVNVILFGIVSI